MTPRPRRRGGGAARVCWRVAGEALNPAVVALSVASGRLAFGSAAQGRRAPEGGRVSVEGRDVERGAVYEAEDRLARWFALGRVRAFGSPWVLETQARFGSVPEVQRYVDAVLGHLGVQRPVTIRERRGATRAHYEPDGVIALPPERIGGQWALQEVVVLHELAHHLAPGQLHGPGFRAAMLRLLRARGHDVAAHLLSIAYVEAGLAPVKGGL